MASFKKAAPYLAGMTMAVIFGLSFLFSKQALADLTPMVLLSYRFGIAALFMTLLLVFKRIKVDFRGKPIGGVILMSIFYPVAAFVLETTGLQYTSTSQAGIMVSLMPVFVSVLGVILLREKVTGAQWSFIASSVTGVFITVIFARGQGDSGAFVGLVLLLLSIVGGSVQNVLSRKYSSRFTPVEITFVMIWLGAVFFNLLAIVQGLMRGALIQTYGALFSSMSAIGAVFYLGVLASVAAFFCMNFMLSRLKAANASVFVNLSTVISILAGVLLLGEKLYWYQAVGGALIVLGVWGTNFFGGREPPQCGEKT